VSNRNENLALSYVGCILLGFPVLGASGSLHDMDLTDLLDSIHPAYRQGIRNEFPELLSALYRQESTKSVKVEDALCGHVENPDSHRHPPILTSDFCSFEDLVTSEVESRLPSSASPFDSLHAAADSPPVVLFPLDNKREEPESEMTMEEDVEEKKLIRAERNRQSAAASRERKKHYVRELERRVSMLSQENANMQVEQLHALMRRVENERHFIQENQELKKKVLFKEMKIQKLEKQMAEAKVSGEKELKRPATWDASTFQNRK